MQWPDLIAALSYYTQQEIPDASFTAATPTFVRNAELRIYRDLDLAAETGQNTSLSTTSGGKTVNLTAMTGQTIQGTPVDYNYPVVVSGIAALVAGAWVQYELASLAWIDMIWPSETISAPPEPGECYYAMLDQQTARLMPPPNGAYPLRITGVWRPAPMSAANPVTYLGDFYPDLLFSAVMVEAMGYQRDFGAQSDNPQTALSWEHRYQDNLRTSKREEAIKQGLGPHYQAVPPAPMADGSQMPPGAAA